MGLSQKSKYVSRYQVFRRVPGTQYVFNSYNCHTCYIKYLHVYSFTLPPLDYEQGLFYFLV